MAVQKNAKYRHLCLQSREGPALPTKLPPKSPLPIATKVGNSQPIAKPATAQPAVPALTKALQSTPATKRLAQDVLDRTLRPPTEEKRAPFSASGADASSATADQVTLEGTTLRAGGKRYELSADLAKQMTLLPPNERVIATLAGSTGSRRPQLFVASSGSGVSHAVRWGLEALKTPFSAVRLTKATTVDKLVGTSRADKSGKIVTTDGPLTAAIRDGGTVVIDGVDRAEPEIKALLLALANGLDVFQHPTSGEPIPVNKGLRLILIADSAKVDPDLLAACPGHQSIRSYTADEHAKLLQAQVGLQAPVARTLADFHQALVERAASTNDAERIDFGSGFSLAWPLLQRAGERLTNEFTPSRGQLTQALYGVYGARLTDENDKVAFAKVLEGFKLDTDPELKVSPRTNSPLTYTPGVQSTLALAEAALDNRETLLLSGPRQSGLTRTVEELAARREQNVVTVIGHSGTDDASLREMPRFKPDGTLFYKRGRVTNALLDGDMLYIDQADYLTPERQNAFFSLLKEGKILVQEDDGSLVEREINKKATVVLSTCTSSDRGPLPLPRGLQTARHGFTEIAHRSPTLDELADVLPRSFPEPVKKLVLDTAAALQAEDGEYNVTRMQKFLDFANSAQLLSKYMTPEQAVRWSAEHVFSAGKAAAVRRLPEPPTEPLWPKILGVDRKAALAKVEAKNLLVVDSVDRHLDTLAVASALKRSVYAVGPASSGKTVLGTIFAIVSGGATIRFNYSGATEARDLMGGIAPKEVNGKTRFTYEEGAAPTAARTKRSVYINDEVGLSREAQLALKPMVDYRRKSIDAEGDVDVPVEDGLILFTDNPTTYAGRGGLANALRESCFEVTVESRGTEESTGIVLSGTKLERELIDPVVSFFADLGNQKTLELLDSAVAPLACTERDMLKAARTAEYFFKRDGITDPDERRRIMGREVFRLISSGLKSKEQADVVFDKLIGKHFGKVNGTQRVNDVPRPQRPTGFEVIEKNGQKFLKLGVAEYPIRAKGAGPGVSQEMIDRLKLPKPPTGAELDARVPADNLELIGPQFKTAEAVLLDMATGTAPSTIVGDTGTGKTVMGRVLAAKLNLPLWEQPYIEGMTKANIFGEVTVTDENKVEMIWTPLVSALLWGGLYVGDEFLTLANDVREGLNAVTEGSELVIPSRPPIKADPRRLEQAREHPLSDQRQRRSQGELLARRGEPRARARIS